MNKIKEWFLQLEKTQRYLFIGIVLSFALIFSFSLINEEKNIVPSDTNLSMNDKIENKQEGNKDEYHKNNEESKEEDTEESQDQGNQKQEQANKNPISDSSDSTVDHEGSKEEVNQIEVTLSIVGLHDQKLVHEVMNIETGTSGFEALKIVCEKYNLNYKTTGFGEYVYISELAGLKENEHGSGSGWKYMVDGTHVNTSSGAIVLEEADVMEWYYAYD